MGGAVLDGDRMGGTTGETAMERGTGDAARDVLVGEVAPLAYWGGGHNVIYPCIAIRHRYFQ